MMLYIKNLLKNQPLFSVSMSQTLTQELSASVQVEFDTDWYLTGQFRLVHVITGTDLYTLIQFGTN